MTDFLFKSTLCLTILLAVYYLLLQKEKMHHFNRYYLLFGLVFSLVIPFVTFEIDIETVALIQQNTFQVLPVAGVAVEEKTNYLSIILWILYGLMTSILFIRFTVHLFKIRKNIQSNPKQKFQNATLVLLEEKVLPHTFLHYIFINKEDYENRKIEAELFTHELTHVRQKHTIDILAIEILKTIFWFNPVLILYKKAIQLNHEFLADGKVVESYNNVPFYQNLLLEKVSWNSTFYLASNLNFLVTKKRLIMMTKTTSAKTILLKKIALLPVITALVYLLSVETVAQQKAATKTTQQSTPSDAKKRDAYYAGVRIKVYKNGKDGNGKTEVIREGLILNKLYEELTAAEKEKYLLYFFIPKPFVKKQPSQKELNEFKNASKYAIWIDGKNVPNSELNKYQPKDIAHFSGSSVFKNARTKKHPQPFQYWFATHAYFDQTKMGEERKKYGSDLIEIFENWDDKKKAKPLREVKKIADDSKDQTKEKLPTFPGGIKAFYGFVGANYNVPEDFKGKGKIFMKFIIEADGSLSNISTLRDVGFGTGDEAKRVLEKCPKWNPAEKDGKSIRYEYSLPIVIDGAK